jgi:two-component sensor histidine kinase
MPRPTPTWRKVMAQPGAVRTRQRAAPSRCMVMEKRQWTDDLVLCTNDRRIAMFPAVAIQPHLMLMDHEWEGTELDELVRLELQPYADRVLANGPSLTLSAKAAQNFALALHELPTNAAKYGAFSRPEGRVYITWSVTNTNGSGQFTFGWQERGGPSVSPPTQKGFGSTVLEHVMAEYFDSPPRIEFASGGVSYEIVGSLDSLGQQQKS